MNHKQHNGLVAIDEMSLKSSVLYNISKDEIVDFHGQEKKFVVAYHLIVLENIIRIIVKKLRNISDANLNILIADQGSYVVRLSNTLGVSTDKAYLCDDGHKVYYIFNLPYLFKCVRNSIMRYNVKFDYYTASWCFIKSLNNMDKERSLRIAAELANRNNPGPRKHESNWLHKLLVSR